MIKISPFTPLFFHPTTDRFGADSSYVQLFAPSDSIFIEVFSTSIGLEGFVVNQITGENKPIEFKSFTTKDSVIIYYATITSLANGYYTVKIGGEESEIFKVTDNETELAETTLIRYSSRSNKQRKDCMFWNGSEQFFFEFRAPGGFKDDDWAFSVNNEQFEISDGNIVELFAIESTQKKFTLGNSIGCPVWFAEHLNRILCCSNVTFNGKRFVRKGNSTPEMTQEIIAKKSYIFKVSLQGMAENVDVELPSGGEEAGGSAGGAGGENYIYLIKLNDETIPTDRNTFSSLRILFEIEKAIKKNNERNDERYLSKVKEDFTKHLLKLLGGAEFGQFIENLPTRTGAKIDSEGNGMFTTLSAKQMRILTLIINKLTALAGDFVMTESGEIESVERIDDRTFRLTMVRKHDNDITDLEVDDVLRANLEDLKVNNVSYMGWYRVLSKNTQDNTLNVVMYPASECEGNVNYPPVANMIVHRWGNATNEERQRCWYISSPEGRIVYLTGVYKPKLEASNYASFYGLPVMLDFLKDKGINPKEPYLWVRGLIVQDIIRVDYQGNVEADIVDRGLYDPAVARGPDPYLCRAKRSTNGRFETHDVWANSCRYRCLKTGTLEVPKWNAVDWVQISGDTELYIKFEKPNGDAFFDVIDCPIIVHVFRGVEEITEDIPDTDIAWSRESGDAASDLAWPSQHPNEKKKIHLVDADCPGESTRFTCTVYVRDGESVREVQAIETINN